MSMQPTSNFRWVKIDTRDGGLRETVGVAAGGPFQFVLQQQFVDVYQTSGDRKWIEWWNIPLVE